jgi:hypothetical protein
MKNLILVLLIGFVLVMGCGGGNPVATRYQGDWVGENGTTLYMYADGKAGFRAGSKEVTGGSAEIDENAKTLTISLFGISETWKIDQEPNEKDEMKLSGVMFMRK